MTGKKILLTRPLRQSQATARLLEAQNIPCLIEPMLRITPLEAELPQGDFQAIAATSPHALDILKQAPSHWYRLPLWVVGDASAARAQKLGFTDIRRGKGAARDMTRRIAQSHRRTQTLLYLRGRHVSFDLRAALEEEGPRVQETVVYEAKAKARLSEALLAELRGKRLGAATFFSARTARIFLTLAQKHGILPLLAETEAFCLSPQIAEAAETAPWRHIHLAASPTRAAMLEALLAWAPKQNLS